MWIAFAFGSAIFAGLTAILAKCGIKSIDSNLATALRTIVVLIFSWIMVFVVGVQNEIINIDLKTLFFLIFSGLTITLISRPACIANDFSTPSNESAIASRFSNLFM